MHTFYRITRLLLLFSLLLSLYTYPIKAQNKKDSLQTELSKAKDDITRVNLLNSLGFELMYQNPDTSILLGKQALEIFNSKFPNRDFKLQENIDNLKPETKHLKHAYANSNSNLGVYYRLKGEYPLSLIYNFEAIKIREAINDIKGLSVSYGNVGNVYADQGDYSKAMEYFFKALEMSEEVKNEKLIAVWIANIGLNYSDMGDYSKALEYDFKALKMAAELGNKNSYAVILGNIGGVYALQAKDPKLHLLESDSLSYRALKYHLKAMAMDEELGNKGGIARHMGNIGSLFTFLKNYKEAELNLQKSVKLSSEIGDIYGVMEINQILSNLYFKTDRYKLAYEHFKQYCEAKDTLFNEEKSKDIGKLEVKHEYELAEVKRKQEEEVRNKEIGEIRERRNSLQYSGIMIFFIFLISGFMLLARRNIPVKLVEGILFFTFLLFFEFLLVLLDPLIESFTRGEPLYKLMINAGVALVIFPVHSFIEEWVKKYYFKTIPLSEKKKNSFPPLLFFILLVLSGLNSGFVDNTMDDSDRTIDSLKKQLETFGLKTKNISRDTILISSLNTLGWQLMYNDPDTAITLSNQALALSEHLPSPNGLASGMKLKFIANSLGNLGAYHYLKADYSKALDYYLKALKINQEMLSRQLTKKNLSEKKIAQKGIAARLSNIGLVYTDQGDYPKALDYYLKALKIDEELADKKEIANRLCNIGIVYWNQADYKKALDYYLKALKTDEELENKIGIASDLGNIGNVYAIQSNYSKALEYYLRALKMDEELGDKNKIAAILGNIGLVCSDQENYTKALDYYLRALKIDEELGNKNGQARHLGNIGSLYAKTAGNLPTLKLREEKFKEAEEYLKKAIVISDTIGALNDLRQFEEILSELYYQTNRYQLAYEHFKKNNIIKDSLFNEEKSKDIGKVEAKHEYELAEMKRKQEEEVRNREIGEIRERKNRLQYSGIFIFIVFIFAGILFSGKLHVPIRIAEGLIFFVFLLMFEFLLVLFDPYIESLTGGEPLYKLMTNAIVAVIIFPLHGFFENLVKKKLI